MAHNDADFLLIVYFLHLFKIFLLYFRGGGGHVDLSVKIKQHFDYFSDMFYSPEICPNNVFSKRIMIADLF